MRDDDGNIIGIVGTSIDVTERKKLIDDLKIAKENAELANHAKTEFIANMSHDIRTPLSGIIGMSRFLEEKTNDPEEKQYARWVNESGEQLLKLLNGVLDVAAAAHLSEHDSLADCFDLRQSIEDIVQLEKPTIRMKNLEFKVDIDKKVPQFVICDRFKLNRILLNLVGNAIKFTQQGYIVLGINQIARDGNTVKLRFSVSDTGPGIPKSLHSRIFEQFYRITPSYKGDHHGHGVGLHIAEKYVSLLGGKIQLESVEGKGTTFYFTIPVTIGVEKNLIASRATQSRDSLVENQLVKFSPSDNKTPLATLLLVEDNAIALRMIEVNVEKLGCRYTSVTNGEKALEIAKSENFDLIITDIGLPGLSGNEFTRQIRAWEKSLNKIPKPIVGLTAHGLAEAETESKQAGMNHILSKPIKLEVLESVLTQFLPEQFDLSSADENKQSNTPTIPNTEEKFFSLDSYPLLDPKEGILNLGDEVVLKNLLGSMISQEIPEMLTKLNKAYETSNWESIQKLAHNLKNSALYCGTMRLKYACQYLEQYRKIGHSELLSKLYQQLVNVMHETVHGVQLWLQKNS